MESAQPVTRHCVSTPHWNLCVGLEPRVPCAVQCARDRAATERAPESRDAAAAGGSTAPEIAALTADIGRYLDGERSTSRRFRSISQALTRSDASLRDDACAPLGTTTTYGAARAHDRLTQWEAAGRLAKRWDAIRCRSSFPCTGACGRQKLGGFRRPEEQPRRQSPGARRRALRRRHSAPRDCKGVASPDRRERRQD